MRILIACQTYFDSRNGPAVFTRRLAESLARAGHAVCVAVPSQQGGARRDGLNGVELEALAALPISRPANVFITYLEGPALRRIFDRFRPELVHLQDHYPLSSAAMREAKRRGLPVVATNHFTPPTMTMQVAAFRLAPRLAERALWWSVLRVFDRADHVTAPTPTAAALIASQGLRPKVTAISCGVDRAEFLPAQVDRAAIRAQLGFAEDRKLAVYVGRVESDKAIEILIRAARVLDRRDLQVGIIGAGRDLERLRRLAAPLGEGVAFPGFVPNELLPSALRSADLFCMPSGIELQSIATLEAMSVGLPVLAADGGALPELVADRVNGRLFRTGDPASAAEALGWLLDRPELWPAMGRESIARSAVHDWGQLLARYVALYQEVQGRLGAAPAEELAAQQGA